MPEQSRIRSKLQRFVVFVSKQTRNLYFPLTADRTSLLCAPFTRFLCSSVGAERRPLIRMSLVPESSQRSQILVSGYPRESGDA